MKRIAIIATLFALSFGGARSEDAGWPAYGGGDGGMRFSPAAQITPSTIDDLVKVWTYQTGDLARLDARLLRRTKFQATPILTDEALVVCTPFNEVIALDPATGEQKWRFDPKIATDNVRPANRFNCRGVAQWIDTAAAAGGVCARRIFAATNDYRLIALDAKTGLPCEDFGSHGQVQIDPGMSLLWPGEFQITSAPVAVGSVVVVGSAIGDNARVVAPRGTVRAFDARNGQPRWDWDPVPRDAADPMTATWGEGWRDVGHANVWAPMSADPERGLIFLPTSSASPDFFGGLRPGDNRWANSVVALRAETGEFVWGYQIVHHDVWDYDTPAQPTLATLDLPDGKRDVVIQGTKQGFIFVLDRDTGVPVFPVEEREVPQNGVAGETLSPTQPFPTHVPAVVPQRITPDDAWGVGGIGEDECRARFEAMRNDGIYTPPSEQGSIVYPMTGGGIDWGGVAFDPVRQIVYANTNRAVHFITLFAADQFETLDERFPDKEVSPQRGAPYGMIREVAISSLGIPCNRPPWGAISAIDLRAGKIVWESVLGTTEELAPLGLALHTGTPNFGGPLVTGGGVVFIGAAMDKYLRGFDAASGEEIWAGRLPVPAQATPMSYEWQGRQYVVIAAGGHGELGTEAGDYFVAFALAGPGDGKPGWFARAYDRPGGRFFVTMFAAGSLFVMLVTALVAWLRRRRRAA